MIEGSLNDTGTGTGTGAENGLAIVHDKKYISIYKYISEYTHSIPT